MDTKRIHEDITQLLYKIEEQYGRIIYFKDSIPMLEIDLALKDVRDLYECLLDLRTVTEHKRRQQGFSKEPVLSASVPVVESKPEPAPVIETKSAPTSVESMKSADHAASQLKTEVQSELNTQPEVKTAESLVEKISETITVVPELKPEEPKIVAAEPEPAAIVPEQPKVEAVQAETKPEPVRTAKEEVAQPAPPPAAKEAPLVAPKKDLLQERQKDFVPTVRKIEFKPENQSSEPSRKESLFDKAASLYDKIAKPTDKTVATQASRQPISNIKSSIGINEKFIYLKDLFKNNINDYNEALDKLNNFESYEEAEDFFQDLKQKYGWDPDSKSFQGLADLLSRRYLHNASS
jgi:hypothetical protein